MYSKERGSCFSLLNKQKQLLLCDIQSEFFYNCRLCLLLLLMAAGGFNSSKQLMSSRCHITQSSNFYRHTDEKEDSHKNIEEDIYLCLFASHRESCFSLSWWRISILACEQLNLMCVLNRLLSTELNFGLEVSLWRLHYQEFFFHH